MSISDAPISSIPISGQPEAAGATPGLPGIRSTRHNFPPVSLLAGSASRREQHWPEISITIIKRITARGAQPAPNVLEGYADRREQRWPEISITIAKRRIARPVYPDPNELNGNAERSEGISADTIYLFVFFPKRYGVPKFPDPNVLNGRAMRREGIEWAKDIHTPVALYRKTAMPQFPDVSVLVGKGKRNEGISEDIVIYTRQGIKTARPVYPDPYALRGTAKRKEGLLWATDEYTPVALYRRAGKQAPFPALLLRGCAKRYKGRPADAVFLDFQQEFIQNYRVEDSDFERYELWIGEDALPDLGGEPAAVSQTLPFNYSIAPPVSGTKTVYAVLRMRDKYGIISANQKTTVFVIDSSGMAVLSPPSAPLEMNLLQGTVGYAVVFLKYNASGDANPADTFKVFASEGSAPDPDTDTPAASATMVTFGGIAYYRALIGPYTPGATLYVIGTAERSSDGQYGAIGPDTIVLAEALALDGDKTTQFGGDQYEIR